MTKISAPRHQRGFALVFVLWLGILLTVLAAGAVLTARAQTAASSAALAQVQAGALAEAGVRRAVLGLLDRRSRSEWTSGLTVDWRYGGGIVRLTVAPEAGRIDINSAREEVIVALAERMATTVDGEIDDEVAKTISDGILDWRDRDDNRRPFGAEEDEYRAAGRPYVPRNGRFESTAELGQVLGVSDAVVGRLNAMVTVHARSPRVSASAVSRDTLLSLPGATELAVDTFLEERAEWRAQQGEAAANQRERSRARLNTSSLGDAARYVSRGGGRVYAVNADATTALGAKASRRVVLRLGGSRRRAPYEVLSWSQLWEAPPPASAAVTADAEDAQ